LKKFFVLWSSQAASIFGSTIVGFALAWYLAKETGSATILATAMMVNFIPPVVLGPFIGPFIDRWNRKKIMIFGDLVTMLLTLALVVLFYTNTIQIWHIYVVMFGRSVSGVFQGPALSASIPMIVPEKHLVRANGLNMTLNGIINIIGPPSGAFLMEALPIHWVLSVDIITAVIAVGCLLPLTIPQPPRTTLTIKFNVIGDMVQGFRYIASWRGLLFLIILGSMLNFFAGPVNALLPLFVTNHLGGDVLKLGWLQTAFGVGVIAGGLILSVWGGFKRRILTCFMGLIIWSIAIFTFGFTTESLFFMGLALVLFAGLGITMNNAPVGAILQATVARDIQGRVFTLVNSIATAMVPLGLAIAGPVADAIGVRTMWYISGAAIFVLVIAGFFSRDLMNIENQKTVEKPAEEAQPLIPQT
jgi:DHA3 family macrolide efflux protein-like MFS transporter